MFGRLLKNNLILKKMGQFSVKKLTPSAFQKNILLKLECRNNIFAKTTTGILIHVAIKFKIQLGVVINSYVYIYVGSPWMHHGSRCYDPKPSVLIHH